MRLLVDTSQVRFTVSKPPEEKRDLDGRQRSDKRTGELLYTVQLVAFDATGGEVITVTLAGSSPKVSVGVMCCAPGRIRTCDTRFRRAVLYPLSYEGRRTRV